MDELQEKNFIREKNFIKEGYAINAYPLMFWGAFVFSLMLLVYAGDYLTHSKKSNQLKLNPFLQVTNREFSLFLWQYPHFMRVHAKNKMGYLPGFQYLHKVNMEPELTEHYVEVFPEVLFFYHTWKRLLSSYVVSREISVIEFKEFLNLVDEWKPQNWTSAPKNYFKLVESLNTLKNSDLQDNLPKEVKQAFFGWKNYFKEGVFINEFDLTFFQLELFLKEHPYYARNYWLNVIGDEYPNYLRTIGLQEYDSSQKVPDDEIAPFLRVALYNFFKK